MPAKKGSMAKETILVNKNAWMNEVDRIAAEKKMTRKELNALVAPGKSDVYIETVRNYNPRIDAAVVRNLGKLGADLNLILSIEEEKPEPTEEKDNSEILKSLNSIEQRLTTLNDQMGSVIEALCTLINIWRGAEDGND